MESQKIVLLTVVAVIAIGIFALPSTVSLFSGQHTWYDLSAKGNDVPCEKCHADIADEMVSTGAHLNMKCEVCHRTDKRVGYAKDNNGNVVPGQGAHAASTQECMVCHGGTVKNFDHFESFEVGNCSDCHPVPAAGGFNMTVPPHNQPDLDTGEKAAHLQFVRDSMDEPLMEGANEACIACHTRVGVNITWTKNEYLEFTASENADGNWTIPSFAAGGENKTQVNSSNEWTT
ncbi:MAG: hypothetical protein KAT65_02085 [Methanophagales archaeon]|nr:hypothetical protein [Methanophagales archaeon]